MTTLLDASVLIALSVPSHSDHQAARRWFSTLDGGYASCSTTQGALVRHLMHLGYAQSDISAVVQHLMADGRHRFVGDDVPYTDVDLSILTGHRQVTDAYLAALARSQGSRLATFDHGLALLHPDVADLVPV